MTASQIHPLSAASILDIPDSEPERLFVAGTPNEVIARYRSLAQEWHPDVRKETPEATKVFAQINRLKDRALEKIAEGTWAGANIILLRALSGRALKIHTIRSERTPVGVTHLCRNALVHVVRIEEHDLLISALATLSSLHYADEAMRKEFSPRMPRIREQVPLDDGRTALVMDHDPRSIRLKDLLLHLGGSIDPRHVAWIVSRLLNIACLFEHNGIVHNDLSLEEVHVDPLRHTISLPGAWWYATRSSGSMVALPARTAGLLPPNVLVSRKGDPQVDLELIRATARELMGDPTGMRLTARPEIPPAFAAWTRMPDGGSAREAFRRWMNWTLPESFGPRKFVEMPVTANAVYGIPPVVPCGIGSGCH